MPKLSLVECGRKPTVENLEGLLPESFARLADLYLARGQRQEALELLKRYANQYPNYPTGFWLLGKICHLLNRKEEALEYLHKVLQIVPEHLAALQLVRRIYEESGELALARSYHRQICRLDPLGELELPEVKTNPRILGAEKERNKAEGRKSGPEIGNRFATETMVKLYLEQGHAQLARELCEKILSEQPGNNRIRIILEELEN